MKRVPSTLAASIAAVHKQFLGRLPGHRLNATGSILAMTEREKEERNVRSRTVVVGVVLITALALVTGSVLLIGYVAAAASLLTVVTLLVRKALRRESKVLIESPVPRWVDAEEREAA